MYLFDDQLPSSLKAKSNISFHSGMGKIFSVDKYAEALKRICADRNLNVNLGSNLKEIKADQKVAVFAEKNGDVEKPYDFLHVTPPVCTCFSSPREFGLVLILFHWILDVRAGILESLW
jgi:hypothetical protein